VSASSDNLRVRFPEFADVLIYPDATVDYFIGLAAGEMEAVIWGFFFDPGALALAAHMMKIAKDSAAAGSGGIAPPGAITQVKTGDLQVSYGSTAGGGASIPGDEGLRTTIYGLEYIRLRELVVATPFTIGPVVI